jgi:hypothetical protein
MKKLLLFLVMASSVMPAFAWFGWGRGYWGGRGYGWGRTWGGWGRGCSTCGWY